MVPSRTHKSHGFSLIELLIVVTIVGIISAISYPSYMKYVAISKVAVMASAGQDAKLQVLDNFRANSGTINIPANISLYATPVSNLVNSVKVLASSSGTSSVVAGTISITGIADTIEKGKTYNILIIPVIQYSVTGSGNDKVSVANSINWVYKESSGYVLPPNYPSCTSFKLPPPGC